MILKYRLTSLIQTLILNFKKVSEKTESQLLENETMQFSHQQHLLQTNWTSLFSNITVQDVKIDIQNM